MEQEQKIDMDLIKKEIKAALVFQVNSVVKTGQVKNTTECVLAINEGLNVGLPTIGDEGFTGMIIGHCSGWLCAKGIDVIELDLNILDLVEEVIIEWNGELGIDIS